MTAASPEIAALIEKAAANFDSPADIVSDSRLSKQQKLEALKKWELDARLLGVASEEGMSGGEPSRLDEVKAAEAALRGDNVATPSTQTKSG